MLLISFNLLLQKSCFNRCFKTLTFHKVV